MARRKHVRWQDGSTNPYQTNKLGELVDEYKIIDKGQAYGDWMENHAPYGRNEDGGFNEAVSANPDVLSDEDVAAVDPQASSLTVSEQILMEEAFAALTPEQQEVWELVMRQNYSEYEAAEALGLTRNAVKSRLSKARASFTNYLYENRSKVEEG